MKSWQMQLCDIQGRLFELALKSGYESPAFIEFFMNSQAAASLDETYNRLQWAGEEYLLEELEDEAKGLPGGGMLSSAAGPAPDSEDMIPSGAGPAPDSEDDDPQAFDPKRNCRSGALYSLEVMYWTGYVYRYWHFVTGETSREIYRTADAETMNRCWAGFHTLDVEMAIERLQELRLMKKESSLS